MRKILLPLLSLGALGFAVLHVVGAQQKGPEVMPPGDPARSPYSRTVAGTGLVEAKTENISIGSHLSGVVEEVFVKVGDPIKPGDRLFRLDDRHLKAEQTYRKASLLAAEKQLERLRNQPREEEKAPSKAKVEEAEATLADKRDLLMRARELVARRAIGDEEREQREHAYDVATAQLRRAKAEDRLLLAGAWEWDKEVAAAAVAQAKAQLEQTQTEMDRLVVRCPQANLVRGEVLQVNVRPGEYVGAPPGQALIVLGDVSQKHVRADIDENDIPRFRRGAPAIARLRGDPRREFRLHFVRVEPYVVPKKSLTGDSTERVDTRVLQVIYALELPPNGSYRATDVYVGQQLDVFIEAEPAAPSS